METPESKPIFFEKGNGLGWTLNFDNKWSYVILAGIIGLVVFVVVYSSYYQK